VLLWQCMCSQISDFAVGDAASRPGLEYFESMCLTSNSPSAQLVAWHWAMLVQLHFRGMVRESRKDMMAPALSPSSSSRFSTL